jgi:hypothetical protein
LKRRVFSKDPKQKEKQVAPRQIKIPAKENSDKEAEEVISQRRRPESGRYLLQVNKQTKGSQNINQGKTTYLDNLSEFFFAFNTRFILNPSGSQTTPVLSPLEIVANRKPTRLIASIGANNGLWHMAFDAASM